MYFKIIGSLCVITSCGAFGFLLASQQRRCMGYLQNLIDTLDRMECELRYRATSLPQLCRVSVNNKFGKIQDIFHSLAEELESQISPDPERCMAYVLGRNTDLDEVIRDALMDFGVNLGKFDLEGQLQGITQTRERCIDRLNTLRQNISQRHRSYQTLGLCAGAALAILFV